MKGRFENKPTEAWNNMKREGMTNRWEIFYTGDAQLCTHLKKKNRHDL